MASSIVHAADDRPWSLRSARPVFKVRRDAAFGVLISSDGIGSSVAQKGKSLSWQHRKIELPEP